MSGASTLALFARLIFSLAVVIGLMWIAATMLRRRGMGTAPGRRARPGVQVEVLARRPLGRNASVAVIRIGARSMVLGVTDHQVTKLDDADIDEIDLEEARTTWTVPPGAQQPTSAWKAMLDQIRNRTVRR
jgi:flagellar biosynthetic protein FliO